MLDLIKFLYYAVECPWNDRKNGENNIVTLKSTILKKWKINFCRYCTKVYIYMYISTREHGVENIAGKQ